MTRPTDPNELAARLLEKRGDGGDADREEVATLLQAAAKRIRELEAQIARQPDKGARATASNTDVLITLNKDYVKDYVILEYLNPDEAERLADQIRASVTIARNAEQALLALHRAKREPS